MGMGMLEERPLTEEEYDIEEPNVIDFVIEDHEVNNVIEEVQKRSENEFLIESGTTLHTSVNGSVKDTVTEDITVNVVKYNNHRTWAWIRDESYALQGWVLVESLV